MGPHSYDPGLLPSDAVWITRIPDDSVHVDFDEGEATLRVRHVVVFDGFTVANSLTPNHPALGIARAVVDSMTITWSGVTRTINGFASATEHFRGNFKETSARISVRVTTLNDTGHGFTFVSDPSATSVSHFAQIGRERNGVFF